MIVYETDPCINTGEGLPPCTTNDRVAQYLTKVALDGEISALESYKLTISQRQRLAQ